MPWASTAISVGGSLLGGALGGGSKSGERAMKDAAWRAQSAQEAAYAGTIAALSPYRSAGQSALSELEYLMGTGGYDVDRPTFEKEYSKLKDEVGKGFYQSGVRNTNNSAYINLAQKNYEKKLADWEKGQAEWKQKRESDPRFGYLNRTFTNEDFEKDPGYNFRLEEGERGINRALSARGGFDSGSALKALARYNQDYGSNEFNNAFNRDAANKSRISSFLNQTANLGLAAAGQGAGFAQNTANNIGQIGMNTANQVNQIQQDRNMTYANAIQGAIGNLIYGMNRPKDSGVVSTAPWSTPPLNGYNNNAGNNRWFA